MIAGRKRRAGAAAVLSAAAIGTGLIGALHPGSSPAADRRERERPNIVVIQTDDQTYSTLDSMPRTERLIADRGLRFTRYYTSWPKCGPSRASLLTGQLPHNHGVGAGGGTGYGNLRGKDTLPVWLGRGGYFTAHVGKYVNGYGRGSGSGRTKIPPGWDEWSTNTWVRTQAVYSYFQNENGRLVEYGDRVRDFKQDHLTREAVRILRKRARPAGGDGRPLYLQLDYTAPHNASDQTGAHLVERCIGAAMPAPRHAETHLDAQAPRGGAFDEADVSDKPSAIRDSPPLSPAAIAELDRFESCRLAALESVDEGVAEVMDVLRRRGALRNTYVVFTSDNGYFAGEHRVTVGKDLAYAAASRIPLLIRGPGLERGARTGRLATTADLGTTLASIAGVRDEARHPLDGIDLTADRREAMIHENRNRSYEAIRTRRWLWVEWASGERELYDLRADPHELESLHADPEYAGEARALARRLDDLRGCRGAACR